MTSGRCHDRILELLKRCNTKVSGPKQCQSPIQLLVNQPGDSSQPTRGQGNQPGDRALSLRLVAKPLEQVLCPRWAVAAIEIVSRGGAGAPRAQSPGDRESSGDRALLIRLTAKPRGQSTFDSVDSKVESETHAMSPVDWICMQNAARGRGNR